MSQLSLHEVNISVNVILAISADSWVCQGCAITIATLASKLIR